ncbi:MAG: M16 family metallopeptidase [Chitinophagales bacterium]
MITYNTFQLKNGLRVVVHEDPFTPMAVVNVLYDVGARDEQEHHTGLAHLFEHLMFEGSKNIPNYDEVLHRAGGECNAFTSSDITNYYDSIPANNIETAFWLESDRMLSLSFEEKTLETQKNVVCEEFKETHINQPYGDVWHELQKLTYTTHPYKWPVIGKDLAHIKQTTLQDIKDFFFTHYRPNRAILSIAGGIKTAEIKPLVEKWFGDIPVGPTYKRALPLEPIQQAPKALYLTADVPLDAIYMAFHTCKRSDAEFYATDLMSDILANGGSSRLYRKLVKEQAIFNTIDAYSYDALDKGLFVIEGKLNKGVSFEEAEAALWQELELLQNGELTEYEFRKIKNRVESSIAFAETSLKTKAFSLAYYWLLGDITEVNREVQRYEEVTITQCQKIAKTIFQKHFCSTIYYKAK